VDIRSGNPQFSGSKPGCLDFINNPLEEKIRLHLKVAKSVEALQLSLDWDKLKQILDNLISNVIKYTAEGVVEFGALFSENSLQVFVKDTGIGIPPDELPSIFDRFFRGAKGQHLAIRGTGLGLSIVKGLIQLLNGSIKIESTPGKGTVFQLTIPAKTQVLRQNIYQDEKETESPIPPNNIPITEDEKDNYIYLSMLLKSLGHQVVWAQNGREAIDLMENELFDLIFMDIKMPLMDGIQATQIIHQKFPEIPIIIQSAFSLDQDRKMAFKAGGKAFLTKPINRNEITKLLTSLFI
jgi:CheY-like chemotaxis protein/anti-sigma regulatory factor (Ser/Thr protein kinase)